MTDIYQKRVLDSAEELYDSLAQKITEEEAASIKKAFELANEAHMPQRRQTGEPYILHPLAVAKILSMEMEQADANLIMAALLHDVVEDTPYTTEDIRAMFNEDVAFMVDAVTKRNKAQVDNFQHILGSVHNDIRVLLLKLSDRLHNMRTLVSMRPQKQWKIASETNFFFAPLAGRLGLYQIKSELENLAFSFLNPDDYKYLEQALEEDRKRTEESVKAFVSESYEAISKEIPGCSIGVRYRKPYSVWRDMNQLGCDFYHVPFKHYLRIDYKSALSEEYPEITLSDKEVALKIYSILSGLYKEQSGSFVNYIDQPKSNGYQGIHVKFLNPYSSWEELHIASDAMRRQALLGCIVESKKRWLSRLKTVLKELSEDSDSLMPGIHDSLYNEDIVVYTPKGQPVTLPKDATALDFAFGVHTDIGLHAKFARINGKLSSVKSVLRRGDCVEIGVSQDTLPKTDWLSAVITYKAKKNISDNLKSRPKPKYILCEKCKPLPESDLIGFKDSDGMTTVHSRNCPDAIRYASEKGHTIVAVEDFKSVPNILYPVRINVVSIDRYHLLQDILSCIVEEFHLSMSGLSTKTEDEITYCTIDFAVHSATELRATVKSISAIEGVDSVQIVNL